MRGSFKSLSAISTRCRPSDALSESTSLERFSRKVTRGAIVVGVNGVETKTVEMIIAQPVHGIVEKESPDFLAIFVVEIDRPRPTACYRLA